MAAATTIIPTRWCAAATASCRSTFTFRAVRPPPRRWSTASCSCRRRSAAPPISASTRRGCAMVEPVAAFVERLRARFADAQIEVAEPRGEVGIVFDAGAYHAGCRLLRDEFGFEQLIDVAAVDYLGYGSDEWDTDVSSEGFSRGVEGRGPGRFKFGETTSRQVPEPQGEAGIPMPQRRFAAVLQLLSVANNRRLRVRCFARSEERRGGKERRAMCRWK